MLRRVLALAAACFALAPGAPAQAQFGPPINEHSTLVEGLVVRGFGGPPWWKVTSGESTVYVLAAPGAMPAGVAFDRRLLDMRVKNANEVILAPRVSFWSIGAFALPQSKQLIKDVVESQDRGLEPELAADLRARFAAARGRIGQPETRYGALPPGLAGMVLAADVERRRRPPGEPINSKPLDDIVEEIAKAAHVRVRPARTYGGSTMPAVLDDARRPDEQCLAAILDRIEAPPTPNTDRLEVVRAWAEGDVRPLLDSLRRTSPNRTSIATIRQNQGSVSIKFFTGVCLDQMPRVQRLQQQFVDDEADAITEALKWRGHSVAVVDAGALLVTGGVLDQLRQKGFTITAPDVE